MEDTSDNDSLKEKDSIESEKLDDTILCDINNDTTKKKEERKKKTKNYKKVPIQIYDTSKMSTYEKHLALKNAEGELFCWPSKRKRDDEGEDQQSNKKIKIEEKIIIENESEEIKKEGESILEYLEKAGYRMDHTIETKRLKPFTNINSLSQFIQNQNLKFTNVIETTFNVGISADFFLSNSDQNKSNIVVSFDRMLFNYSYLSKLYLDINYHIQHLLVVGDTSTSLPQFTEHFSDIIFDLIFIDLTNPETCYEKVVNDLHNLKCRCDEDVKILFDHSDHLAEKFMFTLARFSGSSSSSLAAPLHDNIIGNLIASGEIELISTTESQPNSSTLSSSTSSQSKSMPLKDRFQRQIIPHPNPPSIANNFAYGNSIDQFLQTAGYNLRNDIEGHSKSEHFEKFHQIFNQNKHIKTITEIGFNAGHSCQFFLQKIVENNTQSIKEIEMVSFDIILHDYCFYSKVYIDKAFPKMHLLIAGDSNEAVQMYHSLNPLKKFDLIFIDGDHTYQKALLDIENMKNLAHKDTILIIDNIAPHRGVGIQVYEAMKTAIENKIFKYEEHVEVGDYADGFAIGKYHFGDEEPEEKAELAFQNSVLKFKSEISHMKRRIPICELNKIIDNLGSRDIDESLICFTAFRLLNEKPKRKTNANKNSDYVDNWAKNSIARKRNEISKYLREHLDELYRDIDRHPIMKCRFTSQPAEIMQSLNDVTQLIKEYQKLRCGIHDILSPIGKNGKSDRYNDNIAKCNKLWTSLTRLLSRDIFQFLEEYNQVKKVEDISNWLNTNNRNRKEEIEMEIDRWLNSLESFGRDDLSTKNSTLLESCEFQELLRLFRR